MKVIPKDFNYLRKKAIEIGIENGISEKDAEAMAESFVNLKTIRSSVEGMINVHMDDLIRHLFWSRNQTEIYANIYAESTDEASAEISYLYHMIKSELYEARGEVRLMSIIDELLQKTEDEQAKKAEDEKLDNARSMLADGFPLATISKHLKLSTDVIENLREM